MSDKKQSLDPFNPETSVAMAVAREQRAQYIRESLARLTPQPGSGRATSRRGPSLRQPAILVCLSATFLLFYITVLDIELPRTVAPGILLAIFVAATLSSIAGFAFSAICGAILVHLMTGPVQIVELMIVSSIAIQVLSVWALRASIDWKTVPAFLIGGAASIPLGVYLLFHVDPHTFSTVMGVALICYGIFMLFRRPITLRRQFGKVAHGISGFVGGITGGFAGFPGAFVTIWCSLQGWDKRRQRAIYQPFILAMQILTLLVIHFMSLRTQRPGLPALDFAYVPAAIVGTWCGLAVFARLSDRQFGAAINLLLIASGTGLFVA